MRSHSRSRASQRFGHNSYPIDKARRTLIRKPERRGSLPERHEGLTNSDWPPSRRPTNSMNASLVSERNPGFVRIPDRFRARGVQQPFQVFLECLASRSEVGVIDRGTVKRCGKRPITESTKASVRERLALVCGSIQPEGGSCLAFGPSLGKTQVAWCHRGPAGVELVACVAPVGTNSVRSLGSFGSSFLG